MTLHEPDADVWRQLFASLTGDSTVDAAVFANFATRTASPRPRSWLKCTGIAGWLSNRNKFRNMKENPGVRRKPIGAFVYCA